jgi:hypothetical protein
MSSTRLDYGGRGYPPRAGLECPLQRDETARRWGTQILDLGHPPSRHDGDKAEGAGCEQRETGRFGGGIGCLRSDGEVVGDDRGIAGWVDGAQAEIAVQEGRSGGVGREQLLAIKADLGQAQSALETKSWEVDTFEGGDVVERDERRDGEVGLRPRKTGRDDACGAGAEIAWRRGGEGKGDRIAVAGEDEVVDGVGVGG